MVAQTTIPDGDPTQGTSGPSHTELPMVLYSSHPLPKRPEIPPCEPQSPVSYTSDAPMDISEPDEHGPDIRYTTPHETMELGNTFQGCSSVEYTVATGGTNISDSEEDAVRTTKRRYQKQKIRDDRLCQAEQAVERLRNKQSTLREGNEKCKDDVDNLKTRTDELEIAAVTLKETTAALGNRQDSIEDIANKDRTANRTLMTQVAMHEKTTLQLSKQRRSLLEYLDIRMDSEQKVRQEAIDDLINKASNDLARSIDTKITGNNTHLEVVRFPALVAQTFDRTHAFYKQRCDTSDAKVTDMEQRLTKNEGFVTQHNANHQALAESQAQCTEKIEYMAKMINDLQNAREKEKEDVKKQIDGFSKETIEMKNAIRILQESRLEDRKEIDCLTAFHKRHRGNLSSLKADIRGLKDSHADLEKEMAVKVQEVEESSNDLRDAQVAKVEELEARIRGLEEQLRIAHEERVKERPSADQEAVLEKLQSLEQEVAAIKKEQKDWRLELSQEQKGFEAATNSLICSNLMSSRQTIDDHTTLINSMSDCIDALEEKHEAAVQRLTAKHDEQSEAAKVYTNRIERGLQGQIKDQGLTIRSEYETMRDRLRELQSTDPANSVASAQILRAVTQIQEEHSGLKSRMEGLIADNIRLRREKIKLPLLAKRIKILEERSGHTSTGDYTAPPEEPSANFSRFIPQ